MLLVVLRGDEDAWFCQNGEWIKHGRPSAPKPSVSCDWLNGGNQTDGQQPQTESPVVLMSVLEGAEIKSPVSLAGLARGVWFFEASFPVELRDANGRLLAIGPVQAQGEWMTENFVPFIGQLAFDPPETDTGVLIFKKDNPSGDPQFDDSFSINVRFAPTEKMTVAVFFGNSLLAANSNAENDCQAVYRAYRTINKTAAVAQAALSELLSGPTAAEKQAGFFTSINYGVKLQKITIENQIAYADFSADLEYQVGGSCRVLAIRTQIAETLKQFPAVKNVIISINGRTEDVLQP